MKVKVYAKLNLSLNVYPKRGELHSIDSVVTSVDIFDVVTVTPLKEKSIYVTCDAPDIPPMKNSAYLAAVEFQNAFGTNGCKIDIKKGIPMGAGLGGSSADAAAVVYCLCKLYKVPMDSPRINILCADIGSDVNFMLWGGLARMMGKGEDLLPSTLCEPLYFALTTFETQMSTADVYAAFDNLPKKAAAYSDNRKLLPELHRAQIQNAPKFCNMLQDAALSISSWAHDYLQFCDDHNYSCVMTGSGSAFYIACSTKSDAAVLTKLLRCNGFDTRVCKSVKKGIERMIF